jgi:DNA-binding beta-propeller fold protein YncE
VDGDKLCGCCPPAPKFYTSDQVFCDRQRAGIAFDGANIWVVNQGYNLKVDGSVTKLNSANGATLGIFPVGHHPSTAAFDGANIWVANTHDNTVTELRAKDGA